MPEAESAELGQIPQCDWPWVRGKWVFGAAAFDRLVDRASNRNEAFVQMIEGRSTFDRQPKGILCAGGTITGVMDWHDSETAPLTLELAGAVFELCREGELVPKFTLARDFIGAYRDSDGPVPEREIASLVRYMRLWIRRNVVKSLSVGTDELDTYIQQQISAFRNLATAEWKP